jgi:hypothetical protein
MGGRRRQTWRACLPRYVLCLPSFFSYSHHSLRPMNAAITREDALLTCKWPWSPPICGDNARTHGALPAQVCLPVSFLFLSSPLSNAVNATRARGHVPSTCKKPTSPPICADEADKRGTLASTGTPLGLLFLFLSYSHHPTRTGGAATTLRRCALSLPLACPTSFFSPTQPPRTMGRTRTGEGASRCSPTFTRMMRANAVLVRPSFSFFLSYSCFQTGRRGHRTPRRYVAPKHKRGLT